MLLHSCSHQQPIFQEIISLIIFQEIISLIISLSRDNISNSSNLSRPTTVFLNWEYFWLQNLDFISANLPNNQQVQVSSNSSLNPLDILPNSAPQNLPITIEISANVEPSIINQLMFLPHPCHPLSLSLPPH